MTLTRDGRLLFATRIVRLFAYGFVSVVLGLYLAALGFSEARIGLLLTLTLVGDTAISLWLSTRADRLGRKRMLLVGAVLMAAAGAVFATSDAFVVLLLAATIGVISPSGNEVGPFLAIEQAALSETVPGARRTAVFAWYGLAGSMATALGALAAGVAAAIGKHLGASDAASYRAVLLGYALFGVALAAMFTRLSPAVEVAAPATRSALGLHRSRGVVLRLASLFALDAFAGGFIVQSLIAYWFRVRHGADDLTLGAIFFASNALGGLSLLAASRLAARFGLVNTMVFTHLPSNVLLVLVPLMPTLPLAIAAWVARSSISQMDVPTRQSYVMAVTAPDERAAAAGVTGVARTIGASASPALTGIFLGNPAWLATPFVLAGMLKIVYDLLLLASFRHVKPPEER
ncbi:MAG: MFS transporter [Planctomycetes bacterium]|nr:MFS transporter [Planctomycetota bacterium]